MRHIPLIGIEQLEALGTHLQKKYGKTYRWIHKNESETGGIGGKAKIIGEVEIPVGLGGVSGTSRCA